MPEPTGQSFSPAHELLEVGPAFPTQQTDENQLNDDKFSIQIIGMLTRQTRRPFWPARQFDMAVCA
jgi:hypothetical protein